MPHVGARNMRVRMQKFSADRSKKVTAIIQPGFRPRPEAKHILFDFDGTISLIRAGWREIMGPMFRDIIPERTGESPEERLQIAYEMIDRNTGKDTIFQMEALREEVLARSGSPLEPLAYKAAYLELLNEFIRDRKTRLRADKILRETFSVPGSLTFLEAIAPGRILYLVSGTDHVYVKEEAELLGISGFFGSEGERIFGALDDPTSTHSKARVIREQIMPAIERDAGGRGNFIAIGDGFVEMEEAATTGGLAVGIASDEEHRGSRRFVTFKQRKLTEAGAHIIVPDFLDTEKPLADLLFKTP